MISLLCACITHKDCHRAFLAPQVVFKMVLKGSLSILIYICMCKLGKIAPKTQIGETINMIAILMTFRPLASLIKKVTYQFCAFHHPDNEKMNSFRNQIFHFEYSSMTIHYTVFSFRMYQVCYLFKNSIRTHPIWIETASTKSEPIEVNIENPSKSCMFLTVL